MQKKNLYRKIKCYSQAIKFIYSRKLKINDHEIKGLLRNQS